MSLNPVHGEVCSILHYVVKFVSDLRQVCGFLRVLQFPPPIKLNIVESGIKHVSRIVYPLLTPCNHKTVVNNITCIENDCYFTRGGVCSTPRQFASWESNQMHSSPLEWGVNSAVLMHGHAGKLPGGNTSIEAPY